MEDNYKIDEFLDYLRFTKRYANNTVIAYQKDITTFYTYLQEEYAITAWTEVSRDILRSWLVHLNAKEKLSNKTIHRKISSLKSFFKYLLRQKYIEVNPANMLILPKLSKRLPEFIKEGEMNHILLKKTLVSRDESLSDKDIWHNRTQELALQVFYETGIRLSELVNLKEKNVDFYYKHIKVLGKGNKERFIPLSDTLLQSIKNYIEEKPVKNNAYEEVFVNEKGKKLYPKYFYNAIKKLLSEHGEVHLKKKSPHILRHTFATHLMNQGADINAVKELLGHTSLAATQVYTHNTIEKLKKIYQSAHPKAK